MTPKRTKKYLENEYIKKDRSLADIAAEHNTYPNKIRREIIHYGIQLKDKSQAQKAALKSGRHKHPTEGKHRTTEEKEKIGNSISNQWKGLSEEEKQKRANISKIQFEKMTDQEKDTFRTKAAKAVRHAAIYGSKTEQYLNIELKKRGYEVEFHKESLVANEDLQMDLFLPKLKTVIEIDGPTHYFPIWGEEKLLKHQYADQQKNGLLITNGYNVIRVKVLCKNTSDAFHRGILQKILERLTYLEQNPIFNVEERLFYVD